MIVASETAEFGQPEITLGIIPGGGGTQRLARVIGKQRAMELVLTGRRIDAEEALRLGIVNQVAGRRDWLERGAGAGRSGSPRARRSRSQLAKQAVLAAEETALTRRASSTSAGCTSSRWRPRTGSRACRPSSRSASREFRGPVSVAERVGVVGAGTMGAGIAQLAALGGFETLLHDPSPEALERGLERLRRRLAKGAERGRWSDAAAAEAATRLHGVGELEDLGGCDLVIEAAPEDARAEARAVRATRATSAGPTRCSPPTPPRCR